MEKIPIIDITVADESWQQSITADILQTFVASVCVSCIPFCQEMYHFGESMIKTFKKAC